METIEGIMGVILCVACACLLAVAVKLTINFWKEVIPPKISDPQK